MTRSRLNSSLFSKFRIPDPVEWIQKNVIEKDESTVEKVKVSVIHGDLHGDNLLVDDNRNIWVIDYERCGEGHVYQDFVELETDIINRMSGIHERPEEFVNFCLRIVAPQELNDFPTEAGKIPQINKAFQSIACIRSFAAKCTDRDNIQEYFWGLMFNMVFYSALIKKEHPEKIEFPLLLAGIVCHRLEHWGENWPPTDWGLY